MVKLANKKFATVKNDFAITFDKRTQINEAKDDGSISKIAFEFTKIADIEDGINIKTADVLAVVISVGEQESIKMKDGGSKERKQYMLAD